MKKALQIAEIGWLFIQLPFKVYNGRKKEAYKRIKKSMVAANLL